MSLWTRLNGLLPWSRARRERELDREIRNHLDLEAEDVGPEAARRAFGNVTRVTEDVRETWGWPRFEHLVRDVRHGLRQVRRQPVFSAVAIATLALGIGGVTAMFSAFDAILIRPLPYADAGRLVVIWDEEPSAQIPKQSTTAAEWLAWRRLNTVFTDLAATQPAAATLSGGAEPEQVPARKVTANLWDTLGVKPLIGRVFTESEDEKGVKVAMISYGLWQRRYGGSPDVLGRAITLNDESYLVIGVMPRDFYFLPARQIDIWMPASFPAWMRTNFGWHNAQVVARLKPGVTLERARASMDALSLQLTAKLDPGPHRVILTPLREEIAGKTQTALIVLLCASAALLLIACVNLANLLMARGAARGREVAVRVALGAMRARLVAQFLTESLVLAVLGALAGLALAFPAMRFLETLVPEAMGTVHLTLDWRVLTFCAVMAVAATLIFGLAPALRGARFAPEQALREGGRGTAGTRSHRFQQSLIVVETALAVLLLTSGGLLLDTFQRLRSTDLGFRSEHVLTFEVPLFRYPKLDREVVFVDGLLEKIRAVPGVVSAGASNELPLRVKDMAATFYWIDGQSRNAIQGQVALMRVVTSDYFSAIGAGLREGRFFDSTDRRTSSPVAIVNETFANRHFSGRSPIGARFKYGQLDDAGYWYTIVGVVKEVRETAMAEDRRPAIYRLLEQTEQVSSQPGSIAVRTSVDPASIIPSIRQAIWSVDPNQPVWRFETLDELVDREFTTLQQSTALMGAFAFLALLLASLGLYGVLASTVAQRTSEIGVRIALGATSGQILRTFITRGFALTIAGLAAGSVLAVIAAPAMSAIFYGFHIDYVRAVTTTALILMAVAALACLIPARRASRIDPVVALRNE